MTTAKEVGEAITRQRARTLAMAKAFTDAQWETIVVPGWRTREMIAHLISTDEAGLTGKLFLKMGRKEQADGGLSKVEALNEEFVKKWANRPVPELIRGLERWGRRMARFSAVLPGPVARMKIPMGFGKVSLIWLGMLRVYDEWIHEQDIRRALGMPSDYDDVCVRNAATQLFEVIPFQTKPRIPVGASGRVGVALEGLPQMAVDLATGLVSPADGSEKALIRATAPEIMMVAAQRDPWREAGAIKIEGDRALAEVLLGALLAA